MSALRTIVSLWVVIWTAVIAIYTTLFSVGTRLDWKQESTAPPADRKPKPVPQPNDLPHAA